VAPLESLESLERLGESFALSPATERKRMLVIANPYATTVSDRLKNLVVYALQGRYDVEARDTQERDHATELCREAAHEGYDVVVAFGGDGTVNEAANGLAGSATPLTCLPGGATNVYCKLLGIPGDIVDATEHLLRVADDFRPRLVDLAKVNDRYFTFSSGLGLDASVVKRVDSHPRLKARLGAYYFTYAGLTTFFRHYALRPPQIEVELPDGERLRGATALVQNADPYTYFNNRPIHVAEGATLESGTLAGVVLERSRPTVMPGVIWRLFSSEARVVRSRAVAGFGELTQLRCRVVDGSPVALQVDGDYVGDVTEAVYGVAPRALTVVS
jgi:diacylglycerol kinase family enzyme